jgi:hypothetical protein
LAKLRNQLLESRSGRRMLLDLYSRRCLGSTNRSKVKYGISLYCNISHLPKDGIRLGLQDTRLLLKVLFLLLEREREREREIVTQRDREK